MKKQALFINASLIKCLYLGLIFQLSHSLGLLCFAKELRFPFPIRFNSLHMSLSLQKVEN